MSEQAYEAVELAKKTGKIKKGTNEVTKMIEKGKAKLVVVAGDVSPKEITMHIPMLCKEKGIPCVEVPSREELGAAAGMSGSTVAVVIVEGGEAKEMLKGFSKEALKALREAYKIIYRSNNTVEVAKGELKPLADKFPEVKNMLTFLQQSERGILR